MNKLIVTVGLPRSGKSTWAKEQALPIVNPDSIRLAMHGQIFAKQAEDLVWATAKIMVRALFLAGHETVILDATNLGADRRDAWRDKNWSRKFHVFVTEPSTCKQRALSSSRPELVDVIDRMVKTGTSVDRKELDEGESISVHHTEEYDPEKDSSLNNREEEK